MAQWYVKELSNITGVSVQTLHLYDRKGLLKPSLRLPNGYRVYSEKDLLRLQQIIALKFFGFELAQINELLSGKMPMHEHFHAQAQILQKKAKSLLDVSKQLEGILSGYGPHESIPWQTIIDIIEVYRMTQQAEHAWAVEVLTPDELKQYLRFENELKSKFTPDDERRFGEKWINLIQEAKSNLKINPKSDIGKDIAKRVMDLVCGLYGEEHANLRYSIWENGFKKGKMDEKRNIDPDVVAWLDLAIEHYWQETLSDLLSQVGKGNDVALKAQWDHFMALMCGNSTTMRQGVIDTVMAAPDLSSEAKQWLMQ